jgi:hypothetical protein
MQNICHELIPIYFLESALFIISSVFSIDLPLCTCLPPRAKSNFARFVAFSDTPGGRKVWEFSFIYPGLLQICKARGYSMWVYFYQFIHCLARPYFIKIQIPRHGNVVWSAGDF